MGNHGLVEWALARLLLMPLRMRLSLGVSCRLNWSCRPLHRWMCLTADRYMYTLIVGKEMSWVAKWVAKSIRVPSKVEVALLPTSAKSQVPSSACYIGWLGGLCQPILEKRLSHVEQPVRLGIITLVLDKLYVHTYANAKTGRGVRGNVLRRVWLKPTYGTSEVS